jgi:hypothetical protein
MSSASRHSAKNRSYFGSFRRCRPNTAGTNRKLPRPLPPLSGSGWIMAKAIALALGDVAPLVATGDEGAKRGTTPSTDARASTLADHRDQPDPVVAPACTDLDCSQTPLSCLRAKALCGLRFPKHPSSVRGRCPLAIADPFTLGASTTAAADANRRTSPAGPSPTCRSSRCPSRGSCAVNPPMPQSSAVSVLRQQSPPV